MPDTPPVAESDFDALAALGGTSTDEAAQGAEKGEQKRRAARRSGSSRQPATRTASLEKRLAQSFTAIALGVSAFDPVCGAVVAQRAEPLAAAWNRLAQQNPRVKRMLENLMSGGAYGEALIMTGMTLLPILRHHNLLPFDVVAEEDAMWADVNPNGNGHDIPETMKAQQAPRPPIIDE